MDVSGFILNLTSEQPERLQAFYQDVVGLPPHPEMGEQAMQLGGATLAIDGHSETKGETQEPQRVLLNLFVDDLRAEQARLQAAGVPFIRTEGKEFWGGTFSTFVDPDGNYCQLVEYKPE